MIRTEGNRSVIRFKSAQEDGELKVVASNKAGSAVSYGQLKFTGNRCHGSPTVPYFITTGLLIIVPDKLVVALFKCCIC